MIYIVFWPIFGALLRVPLSQLVLEMQPPLGSILFRLFMMKYLCQTLDTLQTTVDGIGSTSAAVDGIYGGQLVVASSGENITSGSRRIRFS